MSNFKVKLVAPDGVKYEFEASMISLPTLDGQISVLPHHAPLVTIISPGEIIIKNNTAEKYLATEGGIAEITGEMVKILADTADEAQNLDELKILEAQKKAQERLANAKDNVEFADAKNAIEKQLAKLSFLKKRKHKYR